MKLFKFTFQAMTTPCEVQIYDNDEIKAINCFEEIKKHTYELEKKYNFFDSKSYLNRIINNRKRNKISIDSQTYEILSLVKEISLKTRGVFDISVGTIKHCYNQNSLKDVNNCLFSLKDKMGIDSWYLKDNKLNFRFRETKLDLGGVIKEYSVDKAVSITKSYGIKSALINFGGDLFAIGCKPDNEPFCIGIKNPEDKENNLLFVNISNQALTTSANYERNKIIENVEFSHIISKEENKDEIISSTIISSSTLESGIFSTTFMINTECEIIDNMKVVLIDKKLNLHQNLVD
ncbi:FAD:protein FMN transferase [Poseidonibacter lekithochrous]|uniref:FAD:protein FMN transferase n=1 Tax=Poseidonibacter lekithochrous TaxID=1904463 RepID=UPI000D3D1309|nr:FAD:protein FMN transferase [Poseidonibacter lekithochrous]